MDQPTVCCVLLTKDRPEMAARAVRAFRAQTYPAKWLTIYNTGESDEIECGCNAECYHVKADPRGDSIGRLRNRANSFINEYHPPSDIIIHWDDDDVSHSNRIAEQVSLLQSSGAECVGYRECLFWRTSCTCAVTEPDTHEVHCPAVQGEAWLYKVDSPSWVIGASMCYWRRVWEQRPFADLPKQPNGSSEDVVWRREVKCVGVSALRDTCISAPASWKDILPDSSNVKFELQPRLVCGIHGGNTMKYDIEKYPNTWRRVPQFDDTCRRIMER